MSAFARTSEQHATSSQVKVELMDIYKSKVAPGIRKNDVAVIVALVFQR